MLVASIITLLWLKGNPHLAGQGYAVWGTRISAAGSALGLFTWILLPGGCHGGELSYRSQCAANLRGIAQSMAVYANDNGDQFPVVLWAPYSAALNNANGSARSFSATDTVNRYFCPPAQQAGSPQASLWIMVLNRQLSPKSLICRSDAHSRGTALVQDGTAAKAGTVSAYFDNFQDGHQLSYSIAYPWKADGSVGPWWKNTSDATLPILSDMAPEQGTGTPARNLTSVLLSKTANSMNHQADGQNVAFDDGHVDFTRLPNVGHDNDNIFTMSGSPSTGPASTGGFPATKSPPQLSAQKPPFDTLMFPIRNETTGGF